MGRQRSIMVETVDAYVYMNVYACACARACVCVCMCVFVCVGILKPFSIVMFIYISYI